MRSAPLACLNSLTYAEIDCGLTNPSSIALDAERTQVCILRAALVGIPLEDIWTTILPAVISTELVRELYSDVESIFSHPDPSLLLAKWSLSDTATRKQKSWSLL
jgi:hypothetical protein